MRLALLALGPVVVTMSLTVAQCQTQPCPPTGIRCEKTTAVDPGTWIPLCVGTTWQYVKSYASGTDQRGQIIRIRWKSSEEMIAQTRCRGGVAVRIQVTPGDIVREYPAGITADYREWFDNNVATPRTRGYLARGSAVYNFEPSSWSMPCPSLTDEKLKQFDDEAPEFFFPLEKGLKWSDRQREEQDYAAICAASRGQGDYPNAGSYYWLVDGREDLALPWRHVRGAWHLMYPTLGGISHRWFVQHVGAVRESSSHAGSYLEESSALLAFRAGHGCQGKD